MLGAGWHDFINSLIPAVSLEQMEMHPDTSEGHQESSPVWPSPTKLESFNTIQAISLLVSAFSCGINDLPEFLSVWELWVKNSLKMRRKRKSKTQNPKGNGNAAALFMPCLDKPGAKQSFFGEHRCEIEIFSRGEKWGNLCLSPEILHNFTGTAEEPQSPGGHTSVTRWFIVGTLWEQHKHRAEVPEPLTVGTRTLPARLGRIWEISVKRCCLLSGWRVLVVLRGCWVWRPWGGAEVGAVTAPHWPHPHSLDVAWEMGFTSCKHSGVVYFSTICYLVLFNFWISSQAQVLLFSLCCLWSSEAELDLGGKYWCSALPGAMKSNTVRFKLSTFW